MSRHARSAVTIRHARAVLVGIAGTLTGAAVAVAVRGDALGWSGAAALAALAGVFLMLALVTLREVS